MSMDRIFSQISVWIISQLSNSMTLSANKFLSWLDFWRRFFKRLFLNIFCLFEFVTYLNFRHGSGSRESDRSEQTKRASQDRLTNIKRVQKHCWLLRWNQVGFSSLQKSVGLVNFRKSALNRDIEIRRNALNNFAFIIINLPQDTLSESEIKFLLEFFVARFADSGHSADLLVTVVHYLVCQIELWI